MSEPTETSGKTIEIYIMAYPGLDVAEDIAKLMREMSRLSTEASRGLLMCSRVHHIENNIKYFFYNPLYQQ